MSKQRVLSVPTATHLSLIHISTTVEAILDKVAELIKAGRAKEIADMRDETDLSGLKPVSYTHLDVYKRQARLCEVGDLILLIPLGLQELHRVEIHARLGVVPRQTHGPPPGKKGY